jgi:hypothetical protein
MPRAAAPREPNLALKFAIDLLDERTHSPELVSQVARAHALRLRHPEALVDPAKAGDQPRQCLGAPLDQVMEPAGAILQTVQRGKHHPLTMATDIAAVLHLAPQALHTALEPMRQYLELAHPYAGV